MTAGRDLEQSLGCWAEDPADFLLIVTGVQDPLEVVRQVRVVAVVPLIVIVDSIREDLHAALLRGGADLVLAGPYGASLLIAQIEALLTSVVSISPPALSTLSVTGLTLDPATRTVQPADYPPRCLTHLEFRLLYALMTHRGQLMSPDAILASV